MKNADHGRRENQAIPQAQGVEIFNHGYFEDIGNQVKLFLLESKVNAPLANVIIVSPFAKAVHDLFLFTYYLNCNGFNVYRFDPHDHVGLSSGHIENFSLLKLEQDLQKSMDKFNLCKDVPIIILSMSLSFPPALKYFASNLLIDGLISIVGVVDPDFTITTVTGLSPIAYRNSNERLPTYSDSFGNKIRTEIFFDGLVRGEYLSQDDMIKYLQKIKKPIYMIAAEHDEYVRLNDSKKFFEQKYSDGEMKIIPGVTHEIGRSIRATKSIALEVVKYAMKITGISEAPRIPSLVDLILHAEKEAEFINNIQS